MRRLIVAAGLVFFCSQPFSRVQGQDKASAAKQDKKACDLSKIEDGLYCPKCKRVLYNAPAFKIEKLDKDGNCKDCQSKPEKIKVCVKTWVPKCGMCQASHNAPCCKNTRMCCKVETVYSLVTYRCESCKCEAHTEDGLKHNEGAKDCKVVKSCEKTGTFPHGGELPKEK